MAAQEPPVQKKDGTINEKVQNTQTHEQTSGLNQRAPDPNANVTNRPYSISDEERFGDGSQEQEQAKTETAGVTQGHATPQGQKQGHGAEGSSSTGIPEGEDSRHPSSDHNPRTQAAHSGNAHGTDVANQSHTGSSASNRD